MQRAPTVMAFLLFLVLCASVSFWLLQWMAPSPRPVAALPQAARVLPPVAAAANLFGGRTQAAGMAQVQLKGIIRSGSAGSSVAIIAVDGKPARVLRANAEVTSGLTIKAINARSIVLSDRGAERELTLAAFGAQESAMSNLPGRSPEPQPVIQPPQQSTAATPQPAAPQQASGPSTGGTTASSAQGAPTMQAPMPAQRPPPIAAQPESAAPSAVPLQR
jgi:general secretion pathway protein C